MPALLWGVAFANIVRGVPLDADHEFAGGLLDLLNPYALLGGLTTLALFVTHGAVFLALKTTGEIRDRANALAGRTGLVAAALAVAFLAWTLSHPRQPGRRSGSPSRRPSRWSAGWSPTGCAGRAGRSPAPPWRSG